MFVLVPSWGMHVRNGGIRVLGELGSGLVRRGHRVLFLTFDGEQPGAFPTLASHECIGPSPGGRHLLRDWPRQALLQRAIERHADADVILANQVLTAQPVHRARVPGRKFYYMQAYEPDFFRRMPFDWPRVWLAKRTYRYPLRLIANSPGIAAACAGALAPRVPILPPGLDPALYRPAGRRPAGGRPVVGTIARREDWKGTRECFEAVRQARARGLDMEFRVAFGGIPEGFEGEPRVEDMPANDIELADWYRGLDVLLAGVWWGGAPYPPLEAMGCGTAVVTTPNDHVVNERNALTAPQQDPAALSAALERMLSEPELRGRLVAQGLEDASAHYWDHLVERLEAIFTGAIEAPLGGRS